MPKDILSEHRQVEREDKLLLLKIRLTCRAIEKKHNPLIVIEELETEENHL